MSEACSVNGAPYAHLCPTDSIENLQFRLRMAKLGRENEGNAERLWVMCARDPLFFLNTFVWTYDPRKKNPRVPFVAYPFQGQSLVDIVNAEEDILIEKSRDMGATWICSMAFLHEWLFQPYRTFLMVSRKEDLVDKADDPDCLFWKLKFAIDNLPGWMRPQYKKVKLQFLNYANNSTIDGTSTTGDAARGGRRSKIFLDEFASVEEGFEVLKATADVTDVRIFNSTPKGTGNAFYAIKKKGEAKILRFHWSEHPTKAAGLYRSDAEGKLEILDKEYWTPEKADDYYFEIDGKLRSAWYDRECKRRVTSQEIAQELDIDYLASGSPFFDISVLDRAINEFSRKPFLEGELRFNPSSGKPEEFTESEGGRLRLWTTLTADHTPQRGARMAMGVDVSAGSDASNSVITIANCKTREKVCEFVTTHVPPHELAYYAYAIGYWFTGYVDGLQVCWEDNGPGQTFGKSLIELGWANVYLRSDPKDLKRRISTRPGWYSGKQQKLYLLGEYRKDLAQDNFINRSSIALQEAKEYVYGNDGGVHHATSMHIEDPSGAKDNHGDRVIADALCNLVMSEHKQRNELDETPRAQLGSFAYRREIRTRELREEANVW